jgi:hypothetical protein
MSRRNSKITQAFVKRTLRGAAQAGIDINKVRVEIAGDGKIILVPSSTPSAYDDLDQELAAFEARRGEG